MASSPALKIVRQSKPVKVIHRRRAGCQERDVAAPGDPLPFTMTDADIARDLRLSAKTIRRMHTDGRLPPPVVVGLRSLRWVRQTIVDWIAAGCPDRATFEASNAMKKDRQGGEAPLAAGIHSTM